MVIKKNFKKLVNFKSTQNKYIERFNMVVKTFEEFIEEENNRPNQEIKNRYSLIQQML